jgi:hypothetical protein
MAALVNITLEQSGNVMHFARVTSEALRDESVDELAAHGVYAALVLVYEVAWRVKFTLPATALFLLVVFMVVRALSDRYMRRDHFIIAAGGIGPAGAPVNAPQIMPPIDIMPMAAGAVAPVAHVAANYADVGRMMQVAAQTRPHNPPDENTQMQYNDELVFALRPLTLGVAKDGMLIARLKAKAQTWKHHSRISPEAFDTVLPGSIAVALKQTPAYRTAQYALTNDPETALSQDMTKDGSWSYPAVTLRRVLAGDATIGSWVLSFFKRRTRYAS